MPAILLEKNAGLTWLKDHPLPSLLLLTGL